MIAYGAQVDRLAQFDALAIDTLKTAVEEGLDLHGGVALYFQCPVSQDHDCKEGASLMYRELPGVSIESPQPDVFRLKSELGGDVTETFTSLVTAVAFFVEKIKEAAAYAPEISEVLDTLADILLKMLKDKKPDQN